MKFLLVDVWAGHKVKERVGDHEVVYFNPKHYLTGKEYRGYLTAERIVDLYRRSDPCMAAMLDDCLKVIGEDNIEGIAAHQNPFPPEWLASNTDGMVRILGCFDDPQKTYLQTLPVLWAYHGAYYCSPSYSRTMPFQEALEGFGMKNSYWFPLSYTYPTPGHVSAVEASWSKRAAHAVYIGKCYGDKVDKLALFNKAVGGRLNVYGQGWPLGGLAGFVAPLKGRRFFPKWVRPVTEEQKRNVYLSSLIGFNIHLGDCEETGNMRMYEVPMHGAMLLCDEAGCNVHEAIFEPDREAVYYRSIDEAAGKCLYYLEHPEEAIAIAQRGFQRAVRDYHPKKVLKDLLDWGSSIKQGSGRGGKP